MEWNQGVQNCSKGWGEISLSEEEINNFCYGEGGDLFTEGDLRRKDFEDSSLFQS